jgi:hypothetical protein
MALRESQFAEADALFEERAELLKELGPGEVSRGTLSMVNAVNQRMIQEMQAKAHQVASELAAISKYTKARKAYSAGLQKFD